MRERQLRSSGRYTWTGSALGGVYAHPCDQLSVLGQRPPRPVQQLPPASTLKKLSISASVAESPSPSKSAVQHEAQQLPATHAKNASMSASVATSPSLLKSALETSQRAKFVETWLGNLVNWDFASANFK